MPHSRRSIAAQLFELNPGEAAVVVRRRVVGLDSIARPKSATAAA